MKEQLKQLWFDVDHELKNCLKEVDSSLNIAKERLATAVSESIFPEINGVLVKDDDHYSKKQRIAYIVGEIDCLNEVKTSIECLYNQVLGRIASYKMQ